MKERWRVDTRRRHPSNIDLISDGHVETNPSEKRRVLPQKDPIPRTIVEEPSTHQSVTDPTRPMRI